jgi:hypothetical protein
MSQKYHIASPLWLLKDEASVRRHVQSDDYFGTIATVLSLLKQQIKKDGAKNAALLDKTLKNLETDLMFLQKNYRINKRLTRPTGGRSGTPAPRSQPTQHQEQEDKAEREAKEPMIKRH